MRAVDVLNALSAIERLAANYTTFYTTISIVENSPSIVVEMTNGNETFCVHGFVAGYRPISRELETINEIISSYVCKLTAQHIE